MPTFSTYQLIADLQLQTEKMLDTAIIQWQMCSTDVMLFKQNETSWSATQCLLHLNSYGHYYLPAIETSIDEAVEKSWLSTGTFKTSFIGNWFTKLMQPKGEEQIIRKLKSPKEHIPVINENSDAALAEFIEQQETLLQLLQRAESTDLRKARTPITISRFIKLPLGDTFRFVIAHNYRHILQAERSIRMAKEKKVVA